MEFVSISVNWHVYFILALMFVMVFNLLSVLRVDDYFDLIKRLKVLTPVFHSLNAVVAYTGGIVAAFSHDLSITVLLMLATSIFVMILEIKRYKKMRVIKTAEFEKQDEFRVFARKIYMMEISAIVFTYVVSKIF
jgi:hypothetical protein